MEVIQPEWDFYFCMVDGNLASIMLDLAIGPYAPLAEKPALIQVAVMLNQPNEQGMTNEGEAEILYILEDQLAEHISEALGGIYVARNTSDGKRTFYFYCASMVDYERVVDEVMEGFAFHYRAFGFHDAAWALYREFIYPTPLEYQSILNRRVVDEIARQGNDLAEAREITHYLAFETETDQQAYREWVEGLGFAVDEHTSTDGQVLPFQLIITRRDPLEHDLIDDLVAQLMEEALALDGQYLRWEVGLRVG